MYCKHCGKIIDEDSSFCRYCGKNVMVDQGITPFTNDIPIASKRISMFVQSLKNETAKEDIIRRIKSIIFLMWKIMRTTAWVILAIITHLIVGFFMSPFIALFNVEYPDLGFSEKIESIWKKEKNNTEQL